MAILLSMTIFLGADYLNNIQLRTEKESFLNVINYTLSYVKSTNYYAWERYEYIDVQLNSTWVDLTLDSGSWFKDQLELTRSTMVFSGTSDSVRLFPYERECIDLVNWEDMISFSMESSLSDDIFCFERDMRLCKIFVVSCP